MVAPIENMRMEIVAAEMIIRDSVLKKLPLASFGSLTMEAIVPATELLATT